MTETHPYMDNVPSRMNKENFVACFGSVYELSPWIAEKVWDRSLDPAMDAWQDTAEGLHLEFREVVDRGSNRDKLALLCAHPDLAGKLAIAGELTKSSTSEQANADLGKCTPEEFDAFQTLNAQYKEKFSFPFILAVRDYHRLEILEIFRERIENDVETEFATALEQVHRIAELRLLQIK